MDVRSITATERAENHSFHRTWKSLSTLIDFMEQGHSSETDGLLTGQRIPGFLWYQHFSTVFTRVHNGVLSRFRWVPFASLKHISFKIRLILFSHLRLGFPSGVFPWGISTELLHAFRHIWNYCCHAELINKRHPFA